MFPGHTSDPATLGVQLKKLREPYGRSKVTLVGDRGLLTHVRLRDEVEPAGYTLDHGPAEGHSPPGHGAAERAVVVVDV